MISFNPYNQPLESNCSLIITGKNCYKYYRMTDFHNLKVKHESLSKKDALLFSTNYTCHSYVGTNLVVCTDGGDIFFCDQNGDYKTRLVESPGNGYNISCITPVKE